MVAKKAALILRDQAKARRKYVDTNSNAYTTASWLGVLALSYSFLAKSN